MEGTVDQERAARGSFTGSEISAIAHLYRGEVYRSTAWRSRLDNTTNWSVVTIGVALSLSYSEPSASPLPLILVALLVLVFLLLEARRYRYFNVWRARCRLMETDFFAPMLAGEGVARDGKWNQLLSNDYERPRFHVSYLLAMGRRIRKNYCYIFLIQAVAYSGKLVIHPTPLISVDQLFARAAVGPIPGQLVMVAGILFHAGWVLIALLTLRTERKYRRRRALISIG
ncbi:MAG: hypothetical protein AMJ59_24800 [Gammaproteobacteria bacterium SG8_31]|jgi:uncharacterized membrane protein|nr:MAG: hypothetical protein AMJ59_24800 [Gammaproteobacteria bacterium SG8_31]